MKKIIVASLLLTVFLNVMPVVYAADATASSDLQSKLNALKEEIASKAAALKSQINKKIDNKVIPGLIQSKSDSQIILTTVDRNQTVLIDKFTDYQYLGKVSKSLNKDDYIVALGDIDDKSNLVARRVVKMVQPPQDLTKYILGQVKSASPSAIQIIQANGQDLGVSVSRTTDYQMGVKDASLKNVSDGDRIIAVGVIAPETGNLVARFVYIYPAVNSPSPSPTASASATPKTSPKKSS